jgi:hypothetical protein
MDRETGPLELAPIGRHLFILGNSQNDSTAFPSFLDTDATRLLAEPLSYSSNVVAAEDRHVLLSHLKRRVGEMILTSYLGEGEEPLKCQESMAKEQSHC